MFVHHILCLKPCSYWGFQIQMDMFLCSGNRDTPLRWQQNAQSQSGRRQGISLDIRTTWHERTWKLEFGNGKFVIYVDSFQIPERQVAEKRCGAQANGQEQDWACPSEGSLPNTFHVKGMDHTQFGQPCFPEGNCPAMKWLELALFMPSYFNKPDCIAEWLRPCWQCSIQEKLFMFDQLP